MAPKFLVWATEKEGRIAQVRKTVGRADGGGRKGRFALGHVKFEMPLNVQLETLSRQLNVSLELRAEAGGNMNLSIFCDSVSNPWAGWKCLDRGADGAEERMILERQHLDIKNMRRNQFRRPIRSRPRSQIKQLSKGQSDPRGEELLSGQTGWGLRSSHMQGV